MVAQQMVAQRILGYLNGKNDLLALAHLAEDQMFLLMDSDEDIANEVAIRDVLGYLAAGDTAHFPLTWEALTKFLDQLGMKVHVVAEADSRTFR